MKKIFGTIAAILVSFCVFAQDMNVGLLNGPSCIPCAYMVENCPKIDETNVNYEVFASPQELLPKIIKKEIDIGFMPVNVAAKAYEATNHQLLCLAITGEGNLSLISKNKKIQGLNDLKGETVYVAGQGATPEYITKYLLQMENIPLNTKDGVTLDFSIPTNQLAAQFLAGKIQNIIVPEPFRTIVVINTKSQISIIDLQEKEWGKYYTQNYPMTVMVVRKDFANENPHLVKQFLSEYESALNWTLINPEKAGEFCEAAGLGLKKEVVEKAISNANYVYVPAMKGKMIIESLLGIFMEQDPSFLKGTLPDLDFYYKDE